MLTLDLDPATAVKVARWAAHAHRVDSDRSSQLLDRLRRWAAATGLQDDSLDFYLRHGAEETGHAAAAREIRGFERNSTRRLADRMASKLAAQIGTNWLDRLADTWARVPDAVKDQLIQSKWVRVSADGVPDIQALGLSVTRRLVVSRTIVLVSWCADDEFSNQ